VPEQTFSLFFVLSNTCYIAFYYLNANLLIPKLLLQKKTVIYVLIIICLLIFFGLFPRVYQYFFGDIQRFNTAIRPLARARNSRPPILFPGSIAIFLLVFIFSTGIKVISQWMHTERRNKEIEHEKLQTELSFLKAQINPHFLFNTLNNIYSLAADRSDQTAAAVMKLSTIMRYVLNEAKNDFVPLEKEIEFTSHYIQLQKIRITDKTTVDFSIQGDATGKQISPLLFLPFIENAFKYGVSTRELSPILIVLRIDDASLHLEVTNDKHLGSTIKSANNTGIGINNTRRRLELIYHNRYSLETSSSERNFSVNLKINL